MPTKGASNRYGNAGYGQRGHATKHTNYAWAKNFNKATFKGHVNKHMSSMGMNSSEEYRAKAVAFANRVDRENNVSYVRGNGDTVKFNKNTGEYAVISKEGYVNTYFIPTSGMSYYIEDRRRHR